MKTLEPIQERIRQLRSENESINGRLNFVKNALVKSLDEIEHAKDRQQIDEDLLDTVRQRLEQARKELQDSVVE